MKKNLLIGLSILFLSSAVWADIEKIGTVDFQKVVQESSDYKSLKSDLEKQFIPKQKKLIEGQKDLQKGVEELRRNDSVMKEEDKRKKQEELIKKQQELQASEMAFQKEYAAEQEKGFQKIVNKVKEKAVKVAKDEKLDVILSKDAVLYSNGPDVTQKMISALK